MDNQSNPITPIDAESKQLISNTESVVHQTFEDLTDIGDTVDLTKMNVEQLIKEVRKLRQEQFQFKRDVKLLIEEEVAKQIQPLIDKLDAILAGNPKTIYIRPKWKFWEVSKK